MTIQNIIEKILDYHPSIGACKTCDVIIGGSPNVECTGILVSIAPTVEIIKRAIEIGANFILVHEPTFYSGYDDECDWLKINEVYNEKMELLMKNGIVIYRDHDHIHAHKPDGIFHFMLKQMEWLEYATINDIGEYEVNLPEISFGSLLQHVKKKMGIDTIRYIGNTDAKVSKIGFCGHLLPNQTTNWSNNEQLANSWKYDVIIPGEIVEWTLPLYFQDAAMLGKEKGMIIPGHFVQEEAGMRWAEEWLRPLVGENISITFMSAGDMFKYC